MLESEERVREQVASFLHDRIQTDLVTIATEQEGRKNLEDAARLAHPLLSCRDKIL